MANFAISIGLLSLQLSMGLPCIMFARKGYYNLVGKLNFIGYIKLGRPMYIGSLA